MTTAVLTIIKTSLFPSTSAHPPLTSSQQCRALLHNNPLPISRASLACHHSRQRQKTSTACPRMASLISEARPSPRVRRLAEARVVHCASFLFPPFPLSSRHIAAKPTHIRPCAWFTYLHSHPPPPPPPPPPSPAARLWLPFFCSPQRRARWSRW